MVVFSNMFRTFGTVSGVSLRASRAMHIWVATRLSIGSFFIIVRNGAAHDRPITDPLSLPHFSTVMQRAWEMDEEEAYEGPDAYIEGDEIEHQVEEQVEALTEEHGSSVQGILRCEYPIIY